MVNTMPSAISWRAVEKVAHTLAEQNPDAYFRVWVENVETDFSADITLHSTKRGQLSDKSISTLRQNKQVLDGGEDFDGCRAYSIEFLQIVESEPNIILAVSRRSR